jgi:hypothetical protein
MTRLNSIPLLPSSYPGRLASRNSTLHFRLYSVLYSATHSTRLLLYSTCSRQSQSQSHIATYGQSISKSWCRAPPGAHDQIFITVWQLRSWFVGLPLWREDGSVFCICCWPSPVQSISGRSPGGLITIFYCLSFETSLLTASYDSQGHSEGIQPRLHTVWSRLLTVSFYNSLARTIQKTRPLLLTRCVYRAVA